jgi:cbb3-type cytochrome oxidase subunit 1
MKLIGTAISLALAIVSAMTIYLFAHTSVMPANYEVVQRITSEVYNTSGNSAYLFGLFLLAIVTAIGSVVVAVTTLESKTS